MAKQKTAQTEQPALAPVAEDATLADFTEGNDDRMCVTRRGFLLAGGTGAATMLVTVPGLTWPVWAETTGYPRKLLGKVSQLKTDDPINIEYPDEDAPAMLVKLGALAGGGVGGDGDIVAFSTLCTHMGAPMDSVYNAKYKGLGPCPLHQTTFDLTRHGMVVAGHATVSLPQVMLEVKGDNIYATGVMGLIYGRASNL